jgi:hypothetical protein
MKTIKVILTMQVSDERADKVANEIKLSKNDDILLCRSWTDEYIGRNYEVVSAEVVDGA